MNEVEINKQAKLSEHLASPSVAALGNSSELDCTRLSPHFTLGELTKTSAKTADGNIPSHVHIENLKRLCVSWLEPLRAEYNRKYGEGFALGSGPSRMVPPPTGTRPHCESLGTRPQQSSPQRSSLPIIINSGYRSKAVNKAIGGVKGSNHLTGCAVDIHVDGIEQAIRYASILIDISEERKEDFDELLIEGKGFALVSGPSRMAEPPTGTRPHCGSLWLHFAVRPSGNRRKVRFIQT